VRYIFFFSYARDNRDEYLLRFYKDLSRRVQVLSGMSKEEQEVMQIAFLDENNLQLGSEWDPALGEALQNSSVLICAYSPSYFVSEYCSREWHVFQMRRRSWPTFLAGQAAMPPAIKPVVGVAPARRMTRETVHEDVWGVQFTLGQTDAIYNTDGVEPMLRMINRYSDQYQAFLDDLAKTIIAAADLHPPLPALPSPLPPLSTIPPLFPLRTRPPAPVAQPAAQAVFPQQHSALLFATVMLETAAAAAAAADGMPAWRPFDAAGDSIDCIAQSIAMRDLNTTCRIEQVASIAALRALIRDAAGRYQALVMLTDPASAALLADAALDFQGFPLLVLGAASAWPPGQSAVPSVAALRAALVENVPRLMSATRALVHIALPSSINKPIISASDR
jgi:hypothetical protein